MKNHIFYLVLIGVFITSTACNNIKVISFTHKHYKKTLSLKDQVFKTSDGYEIAYSDNMLEDRPTIVFIHGYHVSRYNFYQLASHFKKENYRFILLDLPGFGESSKFPNGDYKLTSQAKRINELIYHLNLKEVHLASTSLGGGVAIALNGMNPEIKSNTLIAPYGMPLYTKEFPGVIDYFIETGIAAFIIKIPYEEERTKKLFSLASNTPSFLIPKFLLNEVKPMFIQGYRATNKVGADILYDKGSFVHVLKEHSKFKKFGKITSELGIDVNQYINNSTNYVPLLNLINESKNVKNTDQIGNAFEDMTPYLRKIENPIIVFWGDKDQIIHYKTMDAMIPNIKNGTYKIIKNGSHMISSTKTKAISKEMKKIIK